MVRADILDFRSTHQTTLRPCHGSKGRPEPGCLSSAQRGCLWWSIFPVGLLALILLIWISSFVTTLTAL